MSNCRSSFFIFILGAVLQLTSLRVLALEEPVYYLDASFSAKEVAVIEADLNYLFGLRFFDTSDSFNRYFGLGESTGVGLINWLRPRGRYILSEDHDFSEESLKGFHFNAPVVSSAIMTNMGAKLYTAAKTLGQSWEFLVRGHSWIKINSPRVGLFKAGSSFFKAPRGEAQSDSKEVNRLFRLMVLVHESRHSDGNQESLGFKHSLCPTGHDYEMMWVCDEPSNGAYHLGALFLSEAIKICLDCTEGDKDFLRVLQGDALARVLNLPEQALLKKESKKDQNLCALLAENSVTADFCEESKTGQIGAAGAEVLWDEAPELISDEEPPNEIEQVGQEDQ